MGLARMRWCFAFLVIVQIAAASQNCLNLKEVNPKRFATTKGNPVPITLGVSERVTHQLVTEVFYIFLKEVLGYPDVLIVNISQSNITTLFESLSANNDIPTYMVDLEVWIPPEMNTIHYTERFAVKECGNIAPPGRYGWFIPKKLFHPQKWKHAIHWDIFQHLNTSRMYTMNDQNMNYLLQFTKNNAGLGYYCNKEFCSKGVYTPTWCRNQNCAVLIAQHAESTSFVVSDIEKLQLYVQVVWVGPNFIKVTKDITSKYNAPGYDSSLLMFLAYTPSVLTLEEEYVSVSFPPCDSFARTSSCNYGNKRLVKFSWSKLYMAARPAYESLQNIEFTAEDYEELVIEYLREKREHPFGEVSLKAVACKWMRNHTNHTAVGTSWRMWEPEDGGRNTLYIGGIFPLSGTDPFFNTAQGIVMSALRAIQAVNNNSDILRDYKLDLLLDNGKCQADIVMKTFIDYIFNNNYQQLVGILGPACSDTVEPLAGVSKHFKTVVISYSAEGSSFSDRSKYPYFFRTIGENKQYKYVYLSLLKQLEWQRVASLTEDGTKYTEYISLTQDLLQKNGITFVANRKFPQDWEIHTMQQYLEEFKSKDARIIIADVNDKAARAVMCQAYHMNMTAEHGYVWFLPQWQTSHWYTTLSDVNCNQQQMIKAINGHMALSHAFFAPNNSLMQENITVKEWRELYEGNLSLTREKGGEASNYAGYAYDAVWAYAYALDALIKKNQSSVASIHSSSTTKQFVDLIQKTNFSGVSGIIQFGNGSSRFSSINVVQWVNNKSMIVGTFEPNITNGTADYAGGRLALKEIEWMNPERKKPWDGTPAKQRCFIEGFANMLNAECQVAVIVANIIGIGFLILILIIAFLVVKHRYDKKVQLTQKYMKSLGIDLLSIGSMGGSLDTWEIPKDKVVINRKLGEGAFGTVYGGEAFFNEKGWVAVAVKTLKVGSTTEEKLDFLSEAEVMKRFEHKNIVQLLGVCTKNEPVYTVMEFMLYGDLKTFLLARRHLVNEKFSDDSDEISSKKLTNMALDVARALSYLAELRYVHRDVASRNCLVNVSRVVKLGDFGMTRPMFENDYYKFNRKGMLPVRWMAPESLALGIFTPASDVWSFGVLLYEIITFGSFPFQGLTNNQVLEHVKLGNTINIPAGIKQQLDWLIKSCWIREYKKRPQASEIVEFLANNPRLLSPCLDVPLSSVQIEDTGQLELTIPQEKPRKFSMSLRQRTPSSPSSNDIRPWTDVAEPLLPSPTRYKATRNSSISEEHNAQNDSSL